MRKSCGRAGGRRSPEGPYVVAGLGEAGRAAVDALCRVTGSERVLASDRYPHKVPKRVRRALEAAGVRTHLGSQRRVLDLPPAPRTLVKSPGIPIDAPMLRLARERGLEVLDELELGWRLNSTPMIAVTGTNGKTTTSTLAAAVLAEAGLRVSLAGNADTAPPLSALKEDLDLIVCEVSSFQLEGCPSLLPGGRGVHQSHARSPPTPRNDAPLRRGQAEPVHQGRRGGAAGGRRHDRRFRTEAGR